MYAVFIPLLHGIEMTHVLTLTVKLQNSALDYGQQADFARGNDI